VNEIDLSGVDWSQIPLEQIERIEILRGPGSVAYGDNAAAGVINIVTKRPQKPFSFEAGVSGGSIIITMRLLPSVENGDPFQVF
jgi:outer membrane receptor for ferrienterochelin and colicin